MRQQLLHNLQTGKFLFAKTCLEKSYKGHTLLQWKNKCILQCDEWLNHLAKCSTLVSLKSDSLTLKKKYYLLSKLFSMVGSILHISIATSLWNCKKSFAVAFAINQYQMYIILFFFSWYGYQYSLIFKIVRQYHIILEQISWRCVIYLYYCMDMLCLNISLPGFRDYQSLECWAIIQ